MKKILFSVLALAMAAFSFTSCEDVPAPYDDPNAGGGGEVVLPEGVLLDQSFTNSLGSFTSVSASGSLNGTTTIQALWLQDSRTSMATVRKRTRPELHILLAPKSTLQVLKTHT